MNNGRGDTPNQHDILTGSNMDGTLATGAGDTTCGNWTSNKGDGSALVGHHDRQGGGANPNSWNSAHPSKGCSQAEPGRHRRQRLLLLLRGEVAALRLAAGTTVRPSGGFPRAAASSF